MAWYLPGRQWRKTHEENRRDARGALLSRAARQPVGQEDYFERPEHHGPAEASKAAQAAEDSPGFQGPHCHEQLEEAQK
jgi:hypothetical protein